MAENLQSLIPSQVVFPPLFESLLVQNRLGYDPLNRTRIDVFAILTHKVLFLHFSRVSSLDLHDIGRIEVHVPCLLGQRRNMVVRVLGQSHRSLDALILFRMTIFLVYDLNVRIRLLNIRGVMKRGDFRSNSAFVLLESHLADPCMVEVVRRI